MLRLIFNLPISVSPENRLSGEDDVSTDYNNGEIATATIRVRPHSSVVYNDGCSTVAHADSRVKQVGISYVKAYVSSAVSRSFSIGTDEFCILDVRDVLYTRFDSRIQCICLN